MNPTKLLELLAAVQSGTITPADATQRLSDMPYEDIGHARIDHHRALRSGLPEVIYAQGKSPQQTAEIFTRMAAAGTDVLATRADDATAALVLASFPKAIHHSSARAITLKLSPKEDPKGHIAILCAGTSDIPIAEEAAVTAELFNSKVTRLYDIGVAYEALAYQAEDEKAAMSMHLTARDKKDLVQSLSRSKNVAAFNKLKLLLAK